MANKWQAGVTAGHYAECPQVSRLNYGEIDKEVPKHKPPKNWKAYEEPMIGQTDPTQHPMKLEIERLTKVNATMLAALDLVVRWFDSVDKGPDIEGIMLTDAIKAARKAIKQAKGGTHA